VARVLGRDRWPLVWYPKGDGYEAGWTVGSNHISQFDLRRITIESKAREAGPGREPEVWFYLRDGEEYLSRWVADPLGGDDALEGRYSLRGAMLWAERHRWVQDRQDYEQRHPRRAALSRLFLIERLRESAFQRWLRKEYPDDDRNSKQLERLIEGEILRRHSAQRASAAARTAEES
jgi:hypothetical protein